MGDAEGLTGGGLPAAPGSLLADLRARRDQAVAKLHLDLPVQGLEPFTVRFRPLTAVELDRVFKAFAESNDPEANIDHDATLIATACVAVWPKSDDLPNPPASAPTFANGVAGALGVDAGSAAAVVRGLYLTDGDVVWTARQVQRWSGFSAEKVDREFEGN